MPAPIPANRFEVWTFPTYEEWIKGTALGITQPRSDRLKKIDLALKEYQASKNDANLSKLRLAFRDWATWKGAKWASSDRNTAAKGALFTRLDKALNSSRKDLSAGDKAALAWQEQMRRLAVARLFAGKQVTLKCVKGAVKSALILNEVRDVYKDIKSAVTPPSATASSASAASSMFPEIKQAMEAMIAKMFDVQTISAIAPHLLSIFGGDVVAAAVPILGHCRSGAMMVRAWSLLASATYARYSTSGHGYAFGAGDPAAAFQALDALLRTEISRTSTGAAIATADFGTRTILAFADAGAISGPITGAATAVAKLTKRVFEISCEYKETKSVNRLLLDPSKLGMELFRAKPLLGAYMICCSSDWDLINMTAAEFGQEGWMDQVEAMKKDHITPVRTTAHTFIENNIYEIKGLTSLANRPTTVAGVAKKIKSKVMGTKKMESASSST